MNIDQLGLTKKEMARVVGFEEPDPRDVLGPHVFREEPAVLIRAFLPRAKEAWVSENGTQRDMERVHPKGLFQCVLPGTMDVPSYRVGFREEGGHTQEAEDPYRFDPGVSDHDLYLLGEGTHYQSYDTLGARVMTIDGVRGVRFMVWAPNARAVSVLGNFNHWMHGAHPLMRLKLSGFWSLFVPGLREGELYKFAVRPGHGGEVLEKSDPYAFRSEMRPSTASVVCGLDGHAWQDREWMEQRRGYNFLHKPISVYEVHLGSWKRKGPTGETFLSYDDFSEELVRYVAEQGYTHVEFLPVADHPLDESWGYQVLSFFAPTSRFGTPQDFMRLVDRCHGSGLGVIVDWVPSHFPKDGHGLARFDGREIYAYEDWRKGEHKEWGTLVFDYGRNEVRNFLIANALFWLDKYHVDGLRVDAVASMLYLDYSRKPGEWTPNAFGGRENLEAIDFMKRLNEIVHARFPGVLTIAEESTAWGGVSRPTYLGGLGFSMKWNMGWMHDTLEYFSKDPIYRKFHQGMLTFSMLYAFSENFVLPISHDEVVYGKRSLLEKMPGDDWQKFANTRLFLSYMFAHPGKKLLFMTNDIGQRAEWNCKSSMDWHLLDAAPHAQLQRCVRDLHALYKKHRAFHELDFEPRGFEWIDFSDSDSSVVSFLRWSADGKQALVFVFNMTAVPRLGYRLGVPWEGIYAEVFNSDAEPYGGSGLGNMGEVSALALPWHGRPSSMTVNLPPLGAMVFLREKKS